MKIDKKTEQKAQQDVCRSILEVRQRFFPKAQAKKIEGEKSRDPKIHGTGLTDDLVEEFRNRLAVTMGAGRG